MFTCIICRFETELDDVAVQSVSGRCICLRCFDRETGNVLPMPGALRRELVEALANCETV
jgi:recombinational DNA repair protein (RecF pathway)